MLSFCAILLFTHVDIISGIWTYGPFAFIIMKFFIYDIFISNSKETSRVAKQERKDLETRVNALEKTDLEHLPHLNELYTNVKHISQQVFVDGKIEFGKVIADMNTMRISYEQRFVHHENMYANLDKKIEDVGKKIDANNKEQQEYNHRILTELIKINKG